MHSIYVTGTDTGAGKTRATVALLHTFGARGLRAVGMKPVASGCAVDEGEWRNDDALALLAASSGQPSYYDVNPFALPRATAPEIAAAEAGLQVDLTTLCSAYARLAAEADVVAVEGVGGWLAPLARDLEQAALVHALDLPVVLVVGLRLGCINHARLTARALEGDGVRLTGWIANEIEPDFRDADANLAIVQRYMRAPLLGRIAHGEREPYLDFSASSLSTR
jgi:dethiobiotin synthetase